MHVSRMRERVPSCRIIGTANLPGYALRFHKRSIDGSGKCNAFFTGKSSDTLYGVIYAIATHEKRALDNAEFLGNGYEEVDVQVVSDQTTVSTLTYVAEPRFIDSALKPYHWYKQFVMEGARFHRLPETYLQAIQAVGAVRDPDLERAEQNFRILNGT